MLMVIFLGILGIISLLSHGSILQASLSLFFLELLSAHLELMSTLQNSYGLSPTTYSIIPRSVSYHRDNWKWLAASNVLHLASVSLSLE